MGKLLFKVAMYIVALFFLGLLIFTGKGVL